MKHALTPGNTALWAYVQKRISFGWNWEPIADEIGCSADELVAWVNDYKSPPKKNPLVSATRPVYGNITVSPSSPSALSKNAQRFVAWRREREAAL